MSLKKIHLYSMSINITLFCLLPIHSYSQISWKQAQRQDKTWYNSVEAIRIADQVLLYQRQNGGWIKDVDMATPISETEKQKLLRQKNKVHHSTIDKGATLTQLRFLAKVYNQTNEERFMNAFIHGLQFLLSIQYENGGYAQDPFTTNYQNQITYNDNVMINVLQFLKEITNQTSPFLFIDDTLRLQTQNAVNKGIVCILNTQIIVYGKKTVWCAQHDKVTLNPTSARTYEKISLSGLESVNIVQFLMRIENPNDQIKDSIESAIAWFEESKLTGIKLVRKQDESSPRGYDRIIIEDKDADPLWARFFEIGTNKPIFCGRDGMKKDTLAEIEYERRNGYSWYTGSPRNLLEKDFPEWRKKHR